MINLSKNLKFSPGYRDISISVAGLDGAGKTTIINKLLNEEISETYSTYGINQEIVNINGLKLGLTDLGGKEPFRKSLWPSYISQSDGLIFVVDATKSYKLQESKKWFDCSLKWIKNDSPVLVLLNIWDKQLTNKEIIDVANLFKPTSQAYGIEFMKVSPITGENMKKTVDWLANTIISGLLKSGITVEYFVVYLKTNKGIIEARIRTPANLISAEGIYPIIRYKFAETEGSVLEHMILNNQHVVMAADDKTSCWLVTNVMEQAEELKGANLLMNLLTEFVKEIQGLRDDHLNEITEPELTSYLMRYLVNNQAFWSEIRTPMFEISYIGED